jgi:hypothetical protein
LRVFRLKIVAPTANCRPASGRDGRGMSALAARDTELWRTHMPFRLTIPRGTLACFPRMFGQASGTVDGIVKVVSVCVVARTEVVDGVADVVT